MESVTSAIHREPWNKGKIVGQKSPFKVKDIWALRVRLQMEHRIRELALFNLGIDSKLRGCDLVALKVRDVCHGDQMATRAIESAVEIQPLFSEWAVQRWHYASCFKFKSAPLRNFTFVWACPCQLCTAGSRRARRLNVLYFPFSVTAPIVQALRDFAIGKQGVQQVALREATGTRGAQDARQCVLGISAALGCDCIVSFVGGGSHQRQQAGHG